ncbi:hypothetical protein [uncultured Gammaproteobacteria bacterium]|nr:hypothetical protein [uncultured Gammaproteobacteria bacterium]CAC9584295.1 hypothetical protein [uncultured Gammaproteobacteria bacterium]
MITDNNADAFKYADSVEELEACMNNVLSNMGESTSFDEFLKKLDKEIESMFNTDIVNY